MTTGDISGDVSQLLEKRKDGGDEKKRSLMIKLSPDLVFDRGRSHTGMTQRLLVHANTHIHTPSDKPNYDPVRQPNSHKSLLVCVCASVNTKSKANGEKEANSGTRKTDNWPMHEFKTS